MWRLHQVAPVAPTICQDQLYDMVHGQVAPPTSSPPPPCPPDTSPTRLCTGFANPGAGRSNALNIAERLGLDPTIVAAARSRLGAGVAASNAAIGRLELVAAQVEGERLAAWAVEQQLAALQVGWPGGSGVLLEMLVRNSCVFYTC